MKKKHNRNRGFTLVETLAAVAILVILLGVSMIAAAYYRDYLKITGLDNAAREIYMAAENRAVLLANSRRLSGLMMNAEKTNAITLSAGGEAQTDEYTAYYLSNEETALMVELLPTGSIDPALREGCFYIVYEPVSGCVTDVFYAEEKIITGNFRDFYDKWTTAAREKRMKAAPEVGAMLGYYGGGKAEGTDIGAPSAATVNVIIENKERLTVTVTYTVPDGMDDPDDIQLSVKLNGMIELTDVTYKGRRDGNTWVLDALETGKQFKDLAKGLTPGADFTITAVVESRGNKFDSATASATDNSLFAKGSGAVASIEYLRHLQNLDVAFSGVTNVTSAVQAADIVCFNNNTYFEYEFKPIANENLKSYDGRTKVIRDLRVTPGSLGGKPAAGLFANAESGMKFTDIRLVNASVEASDGTKPLAAGALVGEAENAAFDGCWVYWEPERGQTDLRSLLGSDEAGRGYQYQIVGADAGGLAGALTGGIIQNCLAATTVKGRTVTGGLIGRAYDHIRIENSYADCYLTGGSAAGLIGDLTGTASLTGCYTAGFIDVSSAEAAAGLCLGSGTTATSNVYTVVRCLTAEHTPSAPSIYSLTQQEKEGTDTFENTFYLGTGSVNGADGKSYAEMTDKTGAGFRAQMGVAFAWKTSRASNPYNLQEHLNLVVYSFPGLSSLPHYGDWGAEFKEPSLVYYERYSDGTYGFCGGNARYLIRDLSDQKTIISDGYAVAFLKSDVADTVTEATVAYTSAGQTPETETYQISSLILTMGTNEEGNKAEYYLVPLSEEMVNSGTASENFYQYLKFDLTLGSSLTSGEYFYNSHFAETVIPYVDDAIKWTQDAAEAYAAELAGQKPISIRTPRHLYDLSKFEAYYSNGHVYQFSQGLELDYGSYKGYGLFPAGQIYAQQPIGSRSAPFNGAYYGGCHKIKGLAFQVQEGDDRYYAGLFGYSTGTLRDIVYEMEPENPLTVAMGDGSRNLYIGGLAGGNAGTIQNCAVSGVNLNGLAFGATIYAGGLAGQNDGIIQSCGAEAASLSTDNSNYARGYVGGLVGENTGSIHVSYAVGRVTAIVDSSSEARICGFVGRNSGNIRNSYAAVDLQSSGQNVDTYGFCGVTAGNQEGTFYLNEGNFTYRDVSYAAKQTPRKASTVKYEVLTDSGAGAVQPLLTAGMRWGAAVSGTAGDMFPYPTSVKDAGGNAVHYGEYPRQMELGEMGVYYWEKLVINGNAAYHINLMAVDPKTNTITGQTTLSEAHNDGGVVTEYGYGYYAAAAVDGNVKLTADNIAYISYIPYGQRKDWLNPAYAEFRNAGWIDWKGQSNTQNWPTNEAADQGLSDLMPGYVFHSWDTYHEGPRAADDASDQNRKDRQTRGLSLVKKSQTDTIDPTMGTFTLSQGALKAAFTVNPQFAASISVNEGGMQLAGGASASKPGSADNPFQVRCGMQLQDINWYDTAYTDVPVGYTSYYESNKFPYLNGTSDGNTAKNYYWVQTHDMDWTGEGNVYSENGTEKPGVFFAIAPAYINDLKLQGWFGGHYEGQNYTMKNFHIAINTKNYNVNCMGLFGAVKNAGLRNIVMFSESGNDIIVINGRTESGSNAWYAGGALVGLAQSSTIENCAVAGYTIKDETGRVPSQSNASGGAIGGLVGMTDQPLSGCTASTAVELNFTRDGKDPNPVLVGGLVGSTTSTVQNCYTGGTVQVNTNAAGQIYVGGLTGGQGMVAVADANTTGTAAVENCYSYMDLPQIPNQVTCDMITGKQDKVAFKNNYYLEGGAASSQGTGLSYQQLSGGETINGQKIYTLLPAFEPVTSIIGAFSVSGKYSYPPDSRSDLQGMNYPFPTILTREGQYHVHYGAWPANGILREEGGKPIALDLFAKTAHTETLKLEGVAVGTWSVTSANEAAAAGTIGQDGTLTVTANGVGTTKLTVRHDGCTPFEITVNVTANLSLQPSLIEMFSNASVTVPVTVFGQNPDSYEETALEQAGLTLSTVSAAGLSRSEISQDKYAAADPEAGTEEKIPSIKLASGSEAAATMANVTYTYPYGAQLYPGTSAIAVTTVNPPECRMSEDGTTCTIDFSRYQGRIERLDVEITRGENTSTEIKSENWIITAVNSQGIWAVDLKITLTMDGNTHELTVTPGAPGPAA